MVGSVSGKNYLFLATDEPGLLVYDLSNPLHPSEIAHLKSQDQNIHVTTFGLASGILYGGAGPLWIVDVSIPSAPKEIGNLDYTTSRIAVSGKYLYYEVDQIDRYNHTSRSGISIVDISDPNNLQTLVVGCFRREHIN